MSISFPTLPEQTRVPWMYAEFDPTGASDDASLMPYTVLLVGQMLPTGTAQPYEPCRPMSKRDGDALAGQGSQLAAMIAAYHEANPLTRMIAIPVPDADVGEAAAGAVKLSGTVTSAAPLCLYIGGVLVRASASMGATAESIVERLAAAINGNPDLPVTARNALNTLELTAKNKGENGNDIDLRLGYRDELFPGGITAEIVPMTGGAGNPDPALIIAAMGDDQYHVIAWACTDTASLDALREELTERWGPLRQIDGQAIVVKRGTFGVVTTFAAARGDKHLTVIPSEGSPTSPWVDAAASAGVIAYYANNDPARGFNTLLVPGVLAPHPRDRWPRFPEKNQGYFEGVSGRYVAPDGTVRLQKLITTHRLNDLGAEDKAFLSLNSPLTLSYLRYDWRNYLLLKYPRHKLASDADAKFYNATQPIITPKVGKAEAIARFMVWLEMGLVEGSAQFQRDIIVERNGRNENRMDWLLRPDLMNQFEVGGTLFRHFV